MVLMNMCAKGHIQWSTTDEEREHQSYVAVVSDDADAGNNVVCRKGCRTYCDILNQQKSDRFILSD